MWHVALRLRPMRPSAPLLQARLRPARPVRPVRSVRSSSSTTAPPAAAPPTAAPPAAAAGAPAAPVAAPPPAAPLKPWRPSRGFLGFVAALLVYGGVRVWDWAELQREKALVLGQAHAVAEAPLAVGVAPRRIVIVRNPGGASRYQFEAFIKPVLDAAAVDFTIVDAADPAEARARTAAPDLLKGDPEADGVLVVGSTLFRGGLQGVLDRVRAAPPAQPVTVGYVPLWHAYALARAATQFSEARMFRLLGHAALAVAEGARRPVTDADLARVEALGNHRLDRRQRLTAPADFQPVPAVLPTDAVAIYAPAPGTEHWRDAALARWQAAGGYWTLLPTEVRAFFEAAGLVQPARDAEGMAADGEAAADAVDVTRPLTSARDDSVARSGERVAAAVRIPDEATAAEDLVREQELVRSQLAAVGVAVTADPRPIRLPKLSMYPGSGAPSQA